uniref:Uncharacterized protein n=1 Tax=Sphaerodactylus townsendi TaxID=933632 RepID=A0ACB8EPJ3_9SAUR
MRCSLAEFGSSKLAATAGTQFLDQLKSSSLGQFTSQGSSSTNAASVPATTTSSWDVKPSVSQPSLLSQFDFKSQPEPSPVLSQLSQRQQQQTQAVATPPPGLESFAPQVKGREPSPVDSPTVVGKLLHMSTLSTDSQMLPALQMPQKQIKPAKRKVPPVSKIPSSAVEMPGSTDVSGLNVQFGALEFGLETPLSEFESASGYENASQAPNSILYPKPVIDPLNTSLPMSNTVQEPTYSAPPVTSSSLGCSSQSTSPVTTTSSYDQASLHSRITYQSSMPPSEAAPPAVMNGHGSVRTQPTLDSPASVPASKPETSLPSLPAKGSSLPSTVATTTSLLPSGPLQTASLPSLPQSSELASRSLSQLSSSLSNHQSSLSSVSALSSAALHTHTSVENSTALHPPAASSVASTSAVSTTSAVSSMAGATNSLGLNVASISLPAPTTQAAPLVSSGKAPPNLPQGVPPLLHNQYIVGPGGLLPAYPIYGYDDLQMLQSRLPVMLAVTAHGLNAEPVDGFMV